MSWDGNYSDCAFGSHRPGQTQSIPGRHEQVNRAGSQLGSTCRAVNKELGQEKILHKTQDYTKQKRLFKKAFFFWFTVAIIVEGLLLKNQTAYVKRLFWVTVWWWKQSATIRVGRWEAPASAPVSQSPAALPLTKVMGWGADRTRWGGRATEGGGGGTAMLLIRLAVGGDSFQSISARVRPYLSLPVFLSDSSRTHTLCLAPYSPLFHTSPTSEPKY